MDRRKGRLMNFSQFELLIGDILMWVSNTLVSESV